MNKILNQLANAGVSIWLDDLSRDRINSGNLTELITEKNVVGVTTNPAIFAAALASGEAYLSQLKDIAATNPDPEHCVFELTTSDVSSACDLFLPKFHQSKGRDGRVSIEVSPQLADDEAATVAAAIELWKKIDKPNVLIKIPATDAGCTAITKVIGAGISVNVTLIFGLARYQQVIDAYLSGLELAKENGHDLSQIHSVASFFVSRVDTEIDNRLVELNRPDLSGKAAVANARLAYQLYQHNLAETRWQQLAAKGANPQRPLWASTGVKNPDYSDTMYVDDLVVCDTVNTMPEKTLLAVADHGDLSKYQDQVTGNYQIAQAHLAALAAVGISYNSVISTLEAEGIEKFKIAWDELLTTVAGQIQAN